MRNPLLVLWICCEHKIIPKLVTKSLIYNWFVQRFYPPRFEHYCVVCGRRYTDCWWKDV